MPAVTMNDLLILIGQKEVELALLRQQIAVLTEQGWKEQSRPPAGTAAPDPATAPR